MIKKLILLISLLVGCWIWYVFIWTPSPEERESLSPSSPPVAAKSPPLSQEVQKKDQEEAKKVAYQYIHAYFGAKAEQLEPYVTKQMLLELEKSMKMGSPVKIEKVVLSEVQPPYIDDGITFHAIITTKDEEFDTWFSMMKIDGQWKVVREEEGLSGY